MLLPKRHLVTFQHETSSVYFKQVVQTETVFYNNQKTKKVAEAGLEPTKISLSVSFCFTNHIN